MNNNLHMAFEETAVERVINNVPQVPDHTFSKKFERKMKKLIKQGYKEPAKYHKITLKRLFVCITAALIAAVIMALSTGAVRNYFKNFIMEKFQTHTSVKSNNLENAPETISGSYTMDIPDNFVLESETGNEIFYLYEYRTTDNGFIFVDIWVNSLYISNVNTEDRTLSYIDINGNEGYIIDIGNEEYFISWDNGSYVFNVTGNIGKSALIDVAKSVQKVE